MPAELVRLAVVRGLTGIALTDHDTMEGTPEALEAGKQLGIEVMPGLELSAMQGQTYLHILGYGAALDDPALNAGIARLQKARDERNLKIIDKMADLGFSIGIDEVKNVSKVGQTGRPHIAKVLLSHGIVRTPQEAFERFLKKGAPAYVPRFCYTAQEAIAMIRRAGGIAVLAHPVQIDPGLKGLSALLAELVALGLEGIELYYPTQSASIRKKIRLVAGRYRLLYTGGSDYHGDIRPGTYLAGGKNATVPNKLIDLLKERLAKREYHGREETL